MVQIKMPVGEAIELKQDVTKTVEIEGTVYNLSPEGTILDKEGKLFKTKEQVDELLKATKTPEELEKEKLERERLEKEKASAAAAPVELKIGDEVEIDNASYTIDKDGNAVDKEGKVFKTKAELDKLLTDTSSSNNEDYVAQIQKTTNLVIYNEDKPVTYENSVEGLTSYVTDVHKTGIEIGKKQSLNELFEQFPVAKQFINHLILNNGDPKNFNNIVDYSKITLGEDASQWENIYVAEKTSKGISESEAKVMFKYLNDDKKGKEAAQTSLKYLTELQKQQNEEATTLYEQQQLEEQQAQTKYWNEVSEIIESKTLKIKDELFTIPDVVRINKGGKVVTKTTKDFVDYLSKPIIVKIDNEEYTITQHEYDKYLENKNRKVVDDVFEAFRRFTGYDDSQLITKKAKDQNAKQVIKLSTKSSQSSSQSQSSQKTGAKIILPIKNNQ